MTLKVAINQQGVRSTQPANATVVVVAAALVLILPGMVSAQAAPPDSTAAQTVAENSTVTAPAPDPSTPRTESKSFGSSLATIGRTIGEDELHIVKAPFKVGAIKWDILVVGATVALAATDADEQLLHQVPKSWHDRSIIISNTATYAPAVIVGGMYLAGHLTHNEHEQEVGVRTAESVVDSVILYGAMKAVFARQRPFSGSGEGQFFAGNWKNGSFPSGHSMFAWTIASTVAHQYHSLPLDLLMYGVAGTVSVTRTTARTHFPSDVLVGSVLGYFIGDYVAHKPQNGLGAHASKFQRTRDAVLEHVTIGVE